MRLSTQNLLSLILILLTGVYAVAEDISVMTYYPSPRGVYQELHVGTNGEVRMRPDATIATAPVVPALPAVSRPRIDIGLASIVGSCPLFSSYLYFDENPPANWRYTTTLNAGFVFGGCGNLLSFWTAPSAGAVAGNAVNPATFLQQVSLTEGGNLGIGTTAPARKLSVFGTGGNNVDLKVNGRIQTGDANNAGGVWLDGAGSMFVGQIDANLMGFYGNNGAGWGFRMDKTTGNVGIGTNPLPAGLAKVWMSGKLAAEDVTVAGNVNVGGFQMACDPPGSCAGDALTSDDGGDASWTPQALNTTIWVLSGSSPTAIPIPGGACSNPGPWVMCPVGQYVCGVRRNITGGCGDDNLDISYQPRCCTP